MATTFKSTGHASYQRHGNIQLGNRKLKPIASPVELTQLNNAIVALSKAKNATSEAEMVAQVTEAFRLTRQISRSRIL